MARPATGELRPLTSGGFAARVRVAGERKTFPLPHLSDRSAAQARCNALAVIAKRLEPVTDAGEAERILEMGAKSRPGKGWDAVVVAVDALTSDGTVKVAQSKVPTFAELTREWTSGELHRRCPDHVRAKDSTRDEEIARLYVNDVIGHLPVDLVTLQHAEQVMAAASGRKLERDKLRGGTPREPSQSTRRKIAQLLRHVLALAVYPGRYRESNPIPSGWVPSAKTVKAKECLWPDEDAKLLACRSVPLMRRLAYGILAREGFRTDELGSLRWSDLDLERGRVRLDTNKTKDPRSWWMRPDTTAALVAWRKLTGNPEGSAYVLSEKGVGIDMKPLAKLLRRDLKAAGVTRAELFERSATRQPLRAHDLRATFVTLSLANGKSETFVADRTGHRSSQMINTYRRRAREWTALAAGELRSMVDAIPELGEGVCPSLAPAVARSARFERATYGLGNRCSIQLSYERGAERPHFGRRAEGSA